MFISDGKAYGNKKDQPAFHEGKGRLIFFHAAAGGGGFGLLQHLSPPAMGQEIA